MSDPTPTTSAEREWEVFTAEDGDPALRMTTEGALTSAQRCIDSQRAEIDGYKREQDKLVDENAALREAVQKAREAFNHIPSDRRWGSLQSAIDAFFMAATPTATTREGGEHG